MPARMLSSIPERVWILRSLLTHAAIAGHPLHFVFIRARARLAPARVRPWEYGRGPKGIIIMIIRSRIEGLGR
eukprot:7838249-Pyramimonas_sp.AAC.1